MRKVTVRILQKTAGQGCKRT